MRVGFAGLGLMGRAMAENLCRAGLDVMVHNRSPLACDPLRDFGAKVAASADDLFDQCQAVILMLADDHAVDAVLGRDMAAFCSRVCGRLIVNMGTHSPAFSEALEEDILKAGGRFVEAPVSGSSDMAREGRLVAMLAGQPASVALARPIIAPMCGEVIEIGPVPSAMRMKLAVNLYLVASVTALAEATHFAAASDLDLRQFERIIAAGPLGSAVVSAKLEKMIRRDFSAQAAVRDVVKNAQLIAAAVDQAAAQAPLLHESLVRFTDVRDGGCAAEDMAAVLKSYEGSPGGKPMRPRPPYAQGSAT